LLQIDWILVANATFKVIGRLGGINA